jgi:hypothetical protein
MKIKLLLTSVFMLTTMLVVNAQNKTTNPVKDNGAQTTVFVDSNNNGVCDNYENGTNKGQGFGKGNCVGKGQRNGKQNGFRNGQCRANNKGNMQGKRAGKGRNFVDADKNGVCDFYENRNKK